MVKIYQNNLDVIYRKYKKIIYEDGIETIVISIIIDEKKITPK